MGVNFYYHPVFLKHQPGTGHPESPQRLEAIIESIEKSGLIDKIDIIEPGPVEIKEIQLVHAPSYVEFVLSKKNKDYVFDGDTIACRDTVDAALIAAGAGIMAVDDVVKGNTAMGFCAVRPPGHHAESSRAMGFCIFNNVAIAAAYALERHKLKRVLIFDPDLHHGNGTQNAFYDSPHVLYMSIHRYPYYPGTGFYTEKGRGKGEGFNVNLPLPGGKMDDDYLYITWKVVQRAIEKFQPQIIMVSAGFDAHSLDPLGDMRVTSTGFRKMYRLVFQKAKEYSIPVILFLEGGYSIQGLSESVTYIIDDMVNEEFQDNVGDIVPSEDVMEIVKAATDNTVVEN